MPGPIKVRKHDMPISQDVDSKVEKLPRGPMPHMKKHKKSMHKKGACK